MLKQTINKETCVDFYVLKQASHCDSYLVSLIENYVQNFKILIYTPSFEQSKEIDSFLWSYRPDSFLPHLILEQHGLEAPILISHQEIPKSHLGVLINLTDEISDEYLLFEKIVEFVFPDEKAKIISRQKYKQYLRLGLQINTWEDTCSPLPLWERSPRAARRVRGIL